MQDQSNAVARAAARLAAALDALEAAVHRRVEARREAVALDAEIQLMSEDRSRLAQELDRTHARAARLESAAAHVGERLDVAIESVSDLLERSRAT